MDELTEVQARQLKRALVKATNEVFAQFDMEARPCSFIWIPEAAKFTVQSSKPNGLTFSEITKANKQISLPDGEGSFRIVGVGDPVRINPSLRRTVDWVIRKFKGTMVQIQKSKAFVKDGKTGEQLLIPMDLLATYPVLTAEQVLEKERAGDVEGGERDERPTVD